MRASFPTGVNQGKGGCMSRRMSILVASVATGVAVVGCRDQTTGPNTSQNGTSFTAASVATSHTDISSVPRFAIDLELRGRGTPGAPMTVVARVAAMLQTADAEVSIVAPDLMPVSSRRLTKIGARDPGLVSRRTSIAAGQSLSEQATFIPPEPGYYRVVV